MVRVVEIKQVLPPSWSREGRWQTLIHAINEATGKRITIRSPQRLRPMPGADIKAGQAVAYALATDIDGDPDPLRGLPGVVVETYGRTHAGFDCSVALDVEAVRTRLGLAPDDPQWLAEAGRHVRDGRFIVEADRARLLPRKG